MTYYPIPDIPADATPDERRFYEQVRTTIARLEKFGQAIEVHQPFYADAHYDTDPDTVKEFPVYRADVASEFLYATWTVPFSQDVRHDLTLRWRSGDGAAAPQTIAQIQDASVTTTDWINWLPKRFANVNRSTKLKTGELLTLQIARTGSAVAIKVPNGLLSMYLRRAEVA